MSSWEPSTLVPRVAELQEASRSSDESTKAAQTPRRIVGYRPSLPTRTMDFRHFDFIGAQIDLDDRYVRSVRDRILSDRT
jgi:hypothetical protein